MGRFLPEISAITDGHSTVLDSGLHRSSARATIFSLGMYVQAGWQARGIARRLLERLIAHARMQRGLDQILLTVTEGNQGARTFYERLGFRVYGVEPRAIDPGDGHHLDEILMALDLRA